jgi:hypothetical protein
VIVSAFSLCFVDAARHLVEGITAHDSPEGRASVLIVWLVHFLILLLAVPRMGEESGPEISRPARAAVACTVISGLPWLIAFTGPYPVAFCFNGLMMGFCLATVKAGVLRRSGTLINIWVLGVFLWIGSRCLEWFVDMHNVGLSLMLGGGFLLFVSLQIERWRQRLHREMAMAEGGES